MVQYIKTWDVGDNTILNIMENISREKFFPKSVSDLSYADAMIPIGHGQVSLEPKMIGRILQSLNLKSSDEVLEIGTGTGYLTTLLSKLTKEVYTMEIIPEIANNASNLFKELKISNIATKMGNGMDGWNESRMFDIIIVTGSLPEVPHVLLDKLNNNGRMFITLGTKPVMRATVLTKNNDKMTEEVIFDTNIPKLQDVN
jgi:protein-L-isoaspartate(D-aspartate) O-methyltransferase